MHRRACDAHSLLAQANDVHSPPRIACAIRAHQSFADSVTPDDAPAQSQNANAPSPPLRIARMVCDRRHRASRNERRFDALDTLRKVARALNGTASKYRADAPR